MPLCQSRSWGFTSGTTRGTPGSILHALELSTTTQPAFTAAGANSRLLSPPAENRAISIPSKTLSVRISTATGLPWNSRVFPSERSEAKSRNSSTLKFLSSKIAIISFPTAPVAPTTATMYLSFFLSIFYPLNNIFCDKVSYLGCSKTHLSRCKTF